MPISTTVTTKFSLPSIQIPSDVGSINANPDDVNPIDAYADLLIPNHAKHVDHANIYAYNANPDTNQFGLNLVLKKIKTTNSMSSISNSKEKSSLDLELAKLIPINTEEDEMRKMFESDLKRALEQHSKFETFKPLITPCMVK